MNRYHGMLMAVLGFAFLMGWNGIAAIILICFGVIVWMTRF